MSGPADRSLHVSLPHVIEQGLLLANAADRLDQPAVVPKMSLPGLSYPPSRCAKTAGGSHRSVSDRSDTLSLPGGFVLVGK